MKETNFTKLLSLCLLFLGVLGTSNLKAQCPNGQTEITITVNGEGFTNEVGWVLFDATAGTVLQCFDTEPTTVVNGAAIPTCVPHGNSMEIYTYESFGDNWNGGMITVEATEDASAYTDGCLPVDGVVLSTFAPSADDNDITAGTGDGGINCPTPDLTAGALDFTFTTECLMCTLTCPVDPVDGDGIFEFGTDPGVCEAAVTLPPATISADCVGVGGGTFSGEIANVAACGTTPMTISAAVPPANLSDPVTLKFTINADINSCGPGNDERFSLTAGGTDLETLLGAAPLITNSAAVMNCGTAGPAGCPVANTYGSSNFADQCGEFCMEWTAPFSTLDALLNDGTGNWVVDFMAIGPAISATLCAGDDLMMTASWPAAPVVINDSPFATAGFGDASGVYPVGCTTVTYTTFAPGGIPVTCSVDVCVADTEAPAIPGCPAGDLEFNLLPGECTIVVTYDLGEPTDNCPLINTNNTPNAGTETLIRQGGISGLTGCCGGNYFQLTNTGADAINVASFCGAYGQGGFPSAAGGTGDFEIYLTAIGTNFLGNECNASAWTLLTAATGVPLGGTTNPGAAAPTPTDIPTGGLILNPGETVGVYLTATAGVGSTHYNQNPLQTTWTDGTLALDIGGAIASGYPFCTGFTFGPTRAWAGFAKYSPLGGDLEQIDNSGLTSGDAFPVGSTPQSWEICDFATPPNCTQCNFNVVVNEYPFATEVLASNDNVQVSLDPDGGCTLVSIDAFLEGGPYGCYDNYFFSRTPAYSGPACLTAPGTAAAVAGCPGAPADAVAGMVPFSCEDIGRTITVTIIDPMTCNESWSTVTVEDKIAPEITCDTTIIACTQEFEVGFQNSSSIGELRGPLDVLGNTTEFEFEVLAPGDASIKNLEVCFRLEHTWVDDLNIEIESPDGTVVTLFNAQGTIPDCQDGDNFEVCIGDQYPAFVHPTDCGPLDLTINGNYAPYNGTGIATAPLSTFNGETAGGTWIFRTNDNFPGGDFGTLQWLDAKVQWCGTVGPMATDNCGTPDLTVVSLDSARTCSTSGMILQTWTATDHSGNQASCVSKVTIRKPSFDDLMLPADLLLDCCTDEYPDPGANVVLKDVTVVATAGAIADADNAVRYDFDLNQGQSSERLIKDLNIKFDASHNDIRDLTIEIAQLSPTGAIIASTRRAIFEGEIIYDAANNAIDAEYLLCSNNMFTDINATFDDEGCDVHETCVDFAPSVAGTFAPYQALSSFDGVMVNSPAKAGPDFTILVSDRNNNPNGVPPTDGSSGTINSIEVSYSYNDPTAVAGAFIDGRPISHNDKCGFSVTYEDDVVDVCPTSYKVLRTWKIIDWCNNTKVEHEQTIKVLDSTPPVINAPRTQLEDVDAVTIPVYEPAVASSVHGSCVGNVRLPEMTVCFEDCSGVASWNTYIYSADGINLLDAKDGNGGLMNEALVLDLDEGPEDDVPMPEPILITLPDGTRIVVTSIRLETLKEPDALYLARYVVRDSCGNEATADVFIKLIDRVAPVPICREETQLSLTGAPDEQTTICADDLDEGSYDNCSNVHFFIRKMNDEDDLDPICNVDFGLGPDPSLTFEILGRDGAGAFTLANQCKYTSCVDFGCDDIGTDNQVFLLVVDDYVVDFINDYLDVVFPFIDAIVDYNTLPLTVLPADKLDDELDIFVTNPTFFWQADNDRRNQGKRFFEFYLNEDPNADGLFVLPTAILWEGHYNFCMVNVHIEDKVRPTCVAPADVWINCDELPENVDYGDDAALDALFGEATAADNCNATIEYVSVSNGLDLCGVGRVTRRWRAEDDYGNRSVGSCQQIIMVQPVTNYCITFPGDFEGNCDNTNAPDDLTFVENGCDLLAVSRDFEDFPAADNGECRKEIVTWKVINWCEYDGISDPTRVLRDGNGDGRIDDGEYCSTGSALIYTPNPTQIQYASTGYYEWKQHVKIFDDVAPEISYDGAVKFCGGDLDEDPCTGQVDIEIEVTELCTDKLTTVWAISAFSSSYGVADIDGSGSISMRLPLGTHTARFSSTDDCGNTSTIDITFSVVDCKAPTPVCHNGLSIDVMPLSGMVELWASDFDASSFDYCSDFIFRANVVEDQNGDGIITSDDYVTVLPPDDYILLDCDDVSNGLTMVQLWVSEQDGTADDACADNQDDDYCVTFVEVQDNNGVCSGSKLGLGGKIANEDNESVENVTIEVNSSASMMGTVTTDASGEYEFLLPVGGDYSVTPMRNDDITNGVSTFDLVLISKHILNVQLLDSPYKLLAADANRSNSVSTLDLVAIRKAVLRVSNTFPNNTSWRFVDKAQFLSTGNVFATSIQEVINRNNLATSDLNANFVAIKVGDVNGDATPNSILGVDDRTFNGNLVFTAAEQSVNAGEEFSVDFVAATNVQGYQFTLDYDEKAVELVDIVDGLATEANNFNVVADKGLIATSWNKDQSTADATMFTLVFRAKADVEVSNIVTVSSEVTTAEAYNVDGDLMGISFEFGGTAQATTFELEQNTPNPFKSETTIGFTLPEASTATITISDVTGKVLKVVKGDYTEGYNTVTLKRSDIGAASGVLSYQLETANNSATKQMIIIE